MWNKLQVSFTFVAKSHYLPSSQVFHLNRFVAIDKEKYSSRKHSYSHIDVEEDKGRGKRRHCDFERSSAMPGDSDIVYRILCLGNMIGRVTGEGGKSLRQETHAKIKIADFICGVEERIITLALQRINKRSMMKRRIVMLRLTMQLRTTLIENLHVLHKMHFLKFMQELSMERVLVT